MRSGPGAGSRLRRWVVRARAHGDRVVGWLIVALAAAACVGALALHLEIGLNNDNQVLLYETQLWLQGRDLYASLVAPSLPMIFMLYAPPVGATLATGLPVTLGFDAWTICLIGLSLSLCHHILERHPRSPDRLIRCLILSLIAVCLVILPLRDNVFGERDHLFVVLATPYLLRLSPHCAATPLGRGARVLIGLSAFLGLGIRPYYLAIFGMQQAYWIFRERSLWRVPCGFETGLVVAAYGAYWLAIAVAAPEYPLTILPMAWATYSAISPPIAHRYGTVLRIWETILCLPLVFSTSLLFTRSRPGPRSLGYLLFLNLGASVSGFAGGWHYAYYPLYVLAFAFAACVIAALLASFRDRWGHARLLSVGWLLAAVILSVVPVYTRLFAPALERGALDLRMQRQSGWPLGHQRIHRDIRRFFERHLGSVPNPHFMLLGNGAWDSNLVNLDSSRTSVSRFHVLWPLPAVVAALGKPEPDGRVVRVAQYLNRSVTEDLQGNRPEMVFVERSVAMWGLPDSFDVLGFFLGHPPFAEAWRDYTLVEKIDRCSLMPVLCAFDVYYRSDRVGPAASRDP